MGKTPPPAPRSRREDILSAALRLFSEHGVEGVTTRQIAAAVGISQPSLYAHFPNRHALAAEVCVRAFGDLADVMNTVLEKIRRGEANLSDMARVYVDFGLTRPDAYRIAFMLDDNGFRDSTAGQAVLTAGVQAYSVHLAAFTLTLGAGLSPEEIEVHAQSIWMSIHGLVSLLIARPQFPWADRERLIAHHISSVYVPNGPRAAGAPRVNPPPRP